MDYKKHVEWFFFAFISGSAGLGVNCLSRLVSSVATLNENFSTLSGQVTFTNKMLSYNEQISHDHEIRIRALEKSRK